jgi:anti-anti-sigma factor
MTQAPLFAIRREENAVVLTPQRDLSEFEFAQIDVEAAELMGRIAKEGGTNVIVDFSKIEYSGSSALSFFTRLFNNTRLRGGEMAFCNVSSGEREVLRITRLDTLWPICESLEEAMAVVTEASRRAAAAKWVVVSDRAVARIFEQPDGFGSELRSVTTLRHPESRARMSDEVSDGPGSFSGGGIAGRESGEPQQDHRHHTAEVFAREVAGYLDAARQRHEFGELTIVAPPLFLGTLRDVLPTPLAKLVRRELHKDYTHLSGEQIRMHLQAADSDK